MKEFDYLYEKHLQTDAEEPAIPAEEKLITIQLTETEFSMLIGSLNKTYINYKMPDKTKQCQDNAYKYADLIDKLYHILVNQE